MSGRVPALNVSAPNVVLEFWPVKQQMSNMIRYFYGTELCCPQHTVDTYTLNGDYFRHSTYSYSHQMLVEAQFNFENIYSSHWNIQETHLVILLLHQCCLWTTWCVIPYVIFSLFSYKFTPVLVILVPLDSIILLFSCSSCSIEEIN